MKLLIFFIIILVLLIIIVNSINNYEFKEMFNDVNNKTLELSKKIYNGNKWNHYRLGDIYYFQDIAKDKWSIDYHIKNYPGSIAEEYIQKNKPIKIKNKELLLSLIEKRKKNQNILNDNDLVLHIRSGDIFTKKYNNIREKYTKYGNTNWWNELINYIKKNNIKRVFILSGAHVNTGIIKSAQYIINRSNFIIDNIPEINIEYILGQSPDKDVIFCSDAKHFISTGGGYGKIIKEIIKK